MLSSLNLSFILFFNLRHLGLLNNRLSSIRLTRRILIALCILTTGLASANVGISSKRIYLDQDKSTDNFVISNRGITQQSCKLSTSHYTFDEFGIMSEYTGNTLPEYAAENVMRFSPKSFHIAANSKQTVRFTLRRKKDIAAREHRAYLVVDCAEITNNSSLNNNNKAGFVQVTIKPKLLHNIPIVIRPKKLTATVEFSNVVLNKNILSFDISRTGNRSVFGKITVTNRNNGQEISQSNPMAIYIETQNKSFNMAIPEGNTLADLMITLNESAEYGGDILQSWPVINEQ
jgi:P pilus assembly chaperone PapD